MTRALLMASALTAVALGTAAWSKATARSSCGAEKYRGLIGRRVEDVPPFPRDYDWRFVSSRAIGATILKPDRLTIVWNTATGRVTELVCR